MTPASRAASVALLALSLVLGHAAPSTFAASSAGAAVPATPSTFAAPSSHASSRAGAAKTVRAAPRGFATITAAELRDYLTFVASDEMEGRDTPSRGLDTTARFLAMQLSQLGIKPAGDNGTYFQKIALVRRTIDPAQTTARLNERTLTYGTDFLAGDMPGTVEGPLVYVGHGYVVKAKNIDAYKGLDVRGKILIANDGLPQGVTRADTRGRSGPDRWESPRTYAARNGAKGVMFVPSYQTLANWERTRKRDLERGATWMEKLPRDTQQTVPSLTASPSLVDALFANEKIAGGEIFKHAIDRDAVEPFELGATKQLRFTVVSKTVTLATQNVVAKIEGSDPKLKEEYVAIGAHYDHVGIGIPNAAGDAIYNGADDDGSGTTAVLALARAFIEAGAPPKRSILFVWHCGEEKGLWGSDYFTHFPTVPLDRIVTQLNIDMIGRSKAADDTKPADADLTGPDAIYVIGSRMMSTELGDLSERVNKSLLNLAFNYKYDDPQDPQRFFFRSDHYNYARKGVPIIFYFDGVHEDYHRPSDSVEKIDFEKMEKVTRTIYATAVAIADLPARPRVDKTLAKEFTDQ
jgi:Zn-dependent M28 family amino/carboxypeptidase